ncbi:MAG TPA: hypothetical protein VFO59_07810, partial [Dehalococcoidia bacterium]|nr:hypothetical protein [Dehalococcoidia bacterium]
LTTLFGSIVAADVFLLGFLLAGTLADYKESERLPGELASSIESLADECLITVKNKDAAEARAAVAYMATFASLVRRWFYRQERTRTLMDRITGMNDIFLSFEPLTQPNFIVRMKQEQALIRKIILRIDTIRDTAFVPAAYAIAEIATALLIAGLIFTELGPLHEEIFYVVLPSFLTIYLIMLIRDLDNPFNYADDDAEAVEVSIKPIVDIDTKLRARAAAIGTPASEPAPYGTSA